MMILSPVAQADEFNKQDVETWTREFMAAVEKGRAAWVDGNLGTNGVACAQCHPNAADTHPETYPKYQQQIGRVVVFGEMINWCIINPLEGKALALDDETLIAMQAYARYERRGVALDPGKH
ncbi:cytochrome C [Emcibacter nanhaiensis]|uniref:Cytochrome C n=2 Tax=Emcibacter nanhaiensis TaxID=1505037 RepID=A0A501PQI5_9PROT|nr:cytochrome C [Emcibacter nanhaiensis]